MDLVKAMPDSVLIISTPRREYVFQLVSSSECVKWATNVVQLAACENMDIDGYIVAEDDRHDDE